MNKEIKNVVLGRLITEWSLALPICYPGQKFNEPDGPFGKASLSLGGVSSAAIGAALLRQFGVLTIQVFLPQETGVNTAYDVSTELARIFDNWTATRSGIAFQFEFTGLLGPFSRETNEQYNVSITFRVDKCDGAESSPDSGSDPNALTFEQLVQQVEDLDSRMNSVEDDNEDDVETLTIDW